MKQYIPGRLRTPSILQSSGEWHPRLKGWALVTMLSGSILIFVLSLITGLIIRGLFSGNNEGTVSLGIVFFLFIIAIIAAVVITHEAVHGLLFLVLEGKPQFGFKIIGRFFPVAYTTSRIRITRNRYLLVALSPFLIMTPVLLVTGVLAVSDNISILVFTAMSLNISGSIADFMSARQVLRHTRKTLFEDTEDGFRWYLPANS